jgi:diacylglycerol kinase family enzyme
LKIRLTGISGEIAQATPLRTVEELTEVGLTKGYSTIIAVGSDSFINKVAHFLINLSLAQDRKQIVMGAIPTDFSTSSMAKILNVSSLDEAIESLRQRHLKMYDVAFIEPNKFFILPIEIYKNKPFYTIVSTKNYSVKSLVNKIKITPSLKCHIQDVKSVATLPRRIVSYLFSRPIKNRYTSVFQSMTFRIESNELVPINLDDEVLAKTPIRLHTIPRLLQLIVPRVIMDKK